jgi:hypothetical protein
VLGQLDHATVRGNRAAGDGGGIWNGGRLSCTSSRAAGNTAGVAGGGLFNAPHGRARVVHSDVQGNQATSGGGMANLGRLAVVRSRVARNHAAKSGGGIWNRGELVLIDVVFAGNVPDDVASP